MRQDKPLQKRRKRCKSCQKLFTPNPRTQRTQRYCSRAGCQTTRQRHNEKNWRLRNPVSVADQREQTRQWYKTHPDYSRLRRASMPQFAQRNRQQTRIRMRKIRQKRLFDKSKVILTQLIGGQTDKCYLTKDCRGLYVRLTKASPLSRLKPLWDNRRRFSRINNRLLKEKLYDVSGMFSSDSTYGYLQDFYRRNGP